MTVIDAKVRPPNVQRVLDYKSGGDGQVVVPSRPPLAGYDEVKSRSLSMKAYAQESLGVGIDFVIDTCCLRRRHDWLKQVACVVSSFIFGTPTWMDGRRRILRERIESVVKAD
ncbi:hypothetical protein BKA82DRAFT_21227 [Pisolithus tinctorius]|uniref:Uncharacterized protein n=1 Tax=Pisolithus tinctorius Marx 270 TaxID=870435 RepID=A0A0C3PN44_PISTI|nr:hypothetical protein BKA82DRAFT_21227 [Pisolithus tinctorius]KIO10241.1 hypothetical protein M404DRAFT_21227 [Pisolithus tinctorius Marx 270]